MNRTFYIDATVRHYTQYYILQWPYCTTLYAILHFTVILLCDITHNMLFYSDPTVRYYTQYGILQWSYCTTKLVRNYHYSLRNNNNNNNKPFSSPSRRKPETTHTAVSFVNANWLQSGWRIRERCSHNANFLHRGVDCYAITATTVKI
jgi:hypothetical protein